MHSFYRNLIAASALLGLPGVAAAAIEGSLDPESVVEQWSTESTSPLIFNINFSDTSWPDTWTKETGRDCPEWADGGYVNAVLNTSVNPEGSVEYPVLFHNCVFANKKSYNGFAGATAAFSRQYYIGESPAGRAPYLNNWKSPGHTVYLEDNIEYNDRNVPVHGEAGFVQMCRNAGITDEAGNQVSLHGWMEIDHIPYVERVQWSWSSTSWGRGIKCDYKVGDGEWKPLVWMGSERQKQGWTSFSDQGYFMENVINASDVSLRWRVWDGEDLQNPVQKDATGACPFNQSIDPFAQRQAPRVHKIRIFGNEITTAQAEFAAQNPVGDVGKLSDLGDFGYTGAIDAPDLDAPVSFAVVAKDGTGDFTTVQAAIDAVPAGGRGIIYIRPGVYKENLYAGRKGESAKFISLFGDDAATTVLESDVNRGGNSTNSYSDCAALNVMSDCFYAENLTIRNTAGNVGQAEALFTNGDAHIFNNCVISGFQDTFKANTGNRGYFTGCTIEGATDFIYDGGLEWFEKCRIVSLSGGHYITAPAETMLPMTKVLYPELSADTFYPGLFFRNCDIVAGEGIAAGDVYLGRPWKENCGAMFIECRLGNHINAAGWSAWGGTENLASLYEYKNTDAQGNLVDTSRRAAFSRQASDAEVAAYMTPEFLFSKASKVSFDFKGTLAGVAAPSDFVITTTGFAWTGDDNAAGYIIYKNGTMAAIVEKAEYSPADYDASALYQVKAVSRRGVTSAAVDVAEAEPLLAFPTAEGFGKYTTGGRGGKVVKVTSLADDGSAGTLRWAFNQYKGEPITIVFEVSGNIVLTSELRVNRADWTLAGQTAPGQGIVITHNKVNLGGSQNFIVRNVRFRIGQKNTAGDILADNACGSENCSNYIFDHCTFGWSVEENMNTADCHFLTVQYCIVHEGLYNAGHSKGARGYGCQWGGSPATYHHNLLADNQSRSCRFNGARGEDNVVFIEYINNVNYNYGKEGNCYGGENTAAISDYNGLNSAHECNFINNYYKPGPASSKTAVVFVNSSYARDGAKSWAPAKWYVAGNIAEGFDAVNADNWLAMRAEGYPLADIRSNERIVTATPYYKYSIAGPVGTYIPERYMMQEFQSATDAFNSVLSHAGTVNRDAIETRIASEARTGVHAYGGSGIGAGKGIIDTENDAEGFIAYPTDYTVGADTDGDGMPDVWETAAGLNPAYPDNNMLNRDGYTALEVYLASLMGETLSTDFDPSGISEIVTDVTMTYDRTSATLRLPEAAKGATVAVYATDGRLLLRQRVNTAEMSLRTLPEGVAIVRLTGRTIAPRSLKIIR